ncbi:MAG: hypothetical protein QF885_08355, partial [Candidatus Thalassarchaeaceae archaeon]|nr:hypothetical protein [Candidatus Thalassarchaeaceae archaeon]
TLSCNESQLLPSNHLKALGIHKTRKCKGLLDFGNVLTYQLIRYTLGKEMMYYLSLLEVCPRHCKL